MVSIYWEAYSPYAWCYVISLILTTLPIVIVIIILELRLRDIQWMEWGCSFTYVLVLARLDYIGEETLGENFEPWLVQTCTRCVRETETPVLAKPVCIDNYKTPEENDPEKKNECVTANMSHKRETKAKKAWQLSPSLVLLETCWRYVCCLERNRTTDVHWKNCHKSCWRIWEPGNLAMRILPTPPAPDKQKINNPEGRNSCFIV